MISKFSNGYSDSDICELYISGKSLMQLSRMSGYSYKKVRKILLDKKVVLRPKHFFSRDQMLNAKKLDIDYFKEIDNPDKSYWLGVISSDGSITKSGYGMSLVSKDRELIERFKISIGSEHKISEIHTFDKRTNKTYHGFCIQITSKDFTNNIIDKGITSNKSYISDFPKIDKSLYNDFIRGLFDGDGSVFKMSKYTIRMALIGSKEMLDHIQEYFYLNYGFEKHPHIKKSENMNVFQIYYFKDTVKILDALYKNSNTDTRLSRKYKIYIDNKRVKSKKSMNESRNFSTKMNFSFDYHGVIDSLPEVFSFLSRSIMKNGGNVHIITGSSWNKELENNLKSMGIEYSHKFSVYDHLLKTAKTVGEIVFPDGTVQKKFEDGAWDHVKGEYCKKNNIVFHVDDTLIYNDFFETPFCRLWSHNNKPKSSHKDVRHLD